MPAKRKASPAKRKAASKRKAARAKGNAAPGKKPARKKAPKPPVDLVTVSCSRCGATGSTVRGGVPGGWSVGFERGRLEYICISCARTNIRAIEGKLPEEWWE